MQVRTYYSTIQVRTNSSDSSCEPQPGRLDYCTDRSQKQNLLLQLFVDLNQYTTRLFLFWLCTAVRVSNFISFGKDTVRSSRLHVT